MTEVYRVDGWSSHGPTNRDDWDAFGSYPTLAAADLAARYAATPESIIIITIHGHRIATYQAGERVTTAKHVRIKA